MTSLPVWANEAIEFLASAIAAKLQQKPGTYNSCTNLPPGTSKKRFNYKCRYHIEGATKQGNVWVCSVEAWDAYHREQHELAELDPYDAAVRKGGVK
jgi:hypothetical protein